MITTDCNTNQSLGKHPAHESEWDHFPKSISASPSSVKLWFWCLEAVKQLSRDQNDPDSCTTTTLLCPPTSSMASYASTPHFLTPFFFSHIFSTSHLNPSGALPLAALVWKFGLCVSNKSSRVMMPLPGDSWARWQLKLPVWISGMAWVVPEPPSLPPGNAGWRGGGEEPGGSCRFNPVTCTWYLTRCTATRGERRRIMCAYMCVR